MAKITGVAVASPAHTKMVSLQEMASLAMLVQCFAMVASLDITSFLRYSHAEHTWPIIWFSLENLGIILLQQQYYYAKLFI